MEAIFISVVFASLMLYLFFNGSSRKQKKLPLPPGPNPLPIIGNIRDLPPKGLLEYEHWLKFKDLYGPISSITVLGRTLIILHGKDAVEELLEKQSVKTSSRPPFTFGKLCGFDRYLFNMPYGAPWRQQRRMIHQYMGTDKVSARFNGIQDLESRRLLLRILSEPRNLIQHLQTEAAAIILKVTYGYSIEPHSSDPLVDLIEQMMDNLSRAMLPLVWAVDILPFLRFIPWMPFQTTAKRWCRINDLVTNVPYSFVQQQTADGTNQSSFVSSLIEEHNQNFGRDSGVEDAIKASAAIMYGGGADTTVSVLSAFVLAMVMFPEVQSKAQGEIDAIIGSDRLPQFGDRDSLPFVSAVVKEATRWFSIAPINGAHAVDEEIHYKGYCIPKGSFLVVSTWWLLHNPETYPNPSKFDPERFLEPRREPDPATVVFGFGRRICPGRYIADKSIFVTIARLLAVFNIQKAVDGEGNHIEVRLQGTPGMISRPMEFPFEVAGRSAAHVELLQNIERDTPWDSGDAEFLSL